jgi:4-amino-4-deoxy-L-arabinose transferase-like glycosyltransferase
MPFQSKVALLLLTCLGAGLRFRALFANHFHADEALFAGWARLIAIWRDPLLLAQAVDKPPLLFYLAALFFPLFGPVEWAARWPNLAASILLVPLTAVLAWQLYHHTGVALLAAALLAASPLAIQFSATVFTDPLLTFFVTASLLFAAGRGRPFWSGFCFGLAVLTKHQAWLFLPLILGPAWVTSWPGRQWRRWLLGLLPVLLLFLGWQVGRGDGLALVGNQWRNFGGLRPAWSWELWPRLRAWGGLGQTLFTPVLSAVALLALAWPWLPRRVKSQTLLMDRLLSIFIFAYLAAHWLPAVPVWDRYLLPVLPLLALLLARLLMAVKAWLWGQWPAASVPGTAVALALLVMILLPGAWAARNGRYAIGGQSAADHGAWQVRDFLADAPYGTVLYDHWYSWHWGYAFIDKGVYTSWFPYPQALAEDLAVFGGQEDMRYLVTPAGEVAQPALRAAAEAGFAPRPVLQTNTQPGMILYRLEPAAR